MKQLKLEVIFGSKNSLSPALKVIVSSSNAAAKALKKTKDEIRALNDQQKKIDGYQKQKKAVQDQAKALQDLQNKIKNLRQQMKANPSADLAREFDKSVAKAQKLKQEYEKNRIELQRMRTEMSNAGLSTNNLAEHQQRLRNQLNQANQSMLEQEKRLKRMQLMQQNYERNAGRLRNVAMGGMGAAMGGAGALYAMRKPIDETKRMDVEENRIASLGLGKQATQEAIQYAKAMQTFGTSTLDNLQLVRDGVTAFADVHHAKMVAPALAKMKFANEAMYGDSGAENEKKFMDMLKVIELRNGLKSEKAFHEQANIIQQVITATGGRVQAEEWLNVIKTGGIAAKGIDNKAFYYKLEPLVQEMGGFRVGTAMMSAYQNVYQGRTTKRAANNMMRLGLISDPSKLKHDKSGQISFLDVGAIKGAALFKKDQFAWMEQVLVPQLKSKGITKEGDIIDAMGSIFTNRTASNLFAQMYMQREQIHKNAKLNAGADNIDQLNSKAMGTTTGKEIEAKANLHDAYLRFGTTILPIYTKAIEMATGGLQAFNGWMERNPTLAKMLGVGLLGIAASLVVIGGTLAVFSPLILGMLSFRLVVASASAGGTGLMRVFSILPTVMNVFKTSLLMVGRTFLWLGRTLLMNPIGLAITAIGVAAYLIYRNWTPIKTFFIGLWASVKNAFNTGVTFIKGIVKSVDAAFASNPILNLLVPIIGIPRTIIANWSGISGFFGALWNEVSSVISTKVNSVLVIVNTGFNAAKVFISGIWNNIKNIVFTAWQGLCNIFAAISPLPYIVSVFNSVFGFLSSLYSRMKLIGNNIIQGLIEGIKAGFEKLKGLWATINAYMPSFMQKRMDIHSPSRVFASLGGHIMGGLQVGLQQGVPALKSKFAGVMDILSPQFPNTAQVISLEPAAVQSVFPDIKGMFSDAVNAFSFSLPDLSQKLNIKPALEQFRLPELTQRMHVESMAMKPVLPDIKGMFSDAVNAFSFSLPDLSQKLNIKPVLEQFRLPELTQRMHVESMAMKPVLPDIKGMFSDAVNAFSFSLPDLSQKLNIKPVLEQFRLPELTQRMHVESMAMKPVLPDIKGMFSDAVNAFSFSLPDLSQKLNIKPALEQFRLPELTQRMHVESMAMKPVLPDIKGMFSDAVNAFSFSLPDLSQKLNIKPVLEQFRLPELTQRMHVESMAMKPVLPDIKGMFSDAVNAFSFSLPDLSQKLNIKPVLEQFRLSELTQRMHVESMAMKPVLPDIKGMFSDAVNAFSFSLPDLSQKLNIKPVLEQFRLPELTQRMHVESMAMKPVLPDIKGMFSDAVNAFSFSLPDLSQKLNIKPVLEQFRLPELTQRMHVESMAMKPVLPDIKGMFSDAVNAFSFSLPDLSQKLNIKPALEQFRLPELTQRMHVESMAMKPVFTDLKLLTPDVGAISHPNIQELIQKINVAPALEKISTPRTLPAGSSTGSVIVQGDTITMHIHAQAGQSAQQIAQVVEQMLNKRQSQKLARARNSYQDSE